jgi:hypothetical protein
MTTKTKPKSRTNAKPPTRQPKDHRLQVQFDVEMFDWLQTESVRRRCSIAQIVRDLVLSEMIDG